MIKINFRKNCIRFLNCLICLCLTIHVSSAYMAFAEGSNIYVEGAYTEENLVVQIYMNTYGLEMISAGVRVIYDTNQLSVIKVLRNNDIWSISDGDTAYPFQPPDINKPGEIIIILGKINLSLPSGITGDRVLLADIEFERKDHAMPPVFTINLEKARGGAFSNFVAINGNILDDIINFGSLQTGSGGNTSQRGDADGNGSIEQGDADAVIYYLRNGGDIHERMDCNDDGKINILDVSCIQNKLKTGG
ncbi:hypothetical protein JXL19_10500, partial [bacterium]|nr:hypothetical protein [bacterium]